jgi:acyl-CoA reductase-like NAD-dependent aldehyde dehydrogenase
MNTQPLAHTDESHESKLKKANLNTPFYNLINGRDDASGGTIDVVNPATGENIASVPDMDRDGLDRAVKAARLAFPAWSAKSFAERRSLLAEFLSKIRENSDELIALLTAEHGRPLVTSQWELQALTEQFGALLLDLELADEKSESKDLGEVVKRYVPLGVVCAISPWNAPVLLSYLKVLAGLLTGNTMVLKPSPFAPLTVLRIAEYARDLLPAGVLNVITGGDKLGPWMTSHAGFDKVTFTGSTQTGKRVMESAAASLARVTLELGGNDAAIVLPDADPDQIAPALFWSMFMLNGHACVSLKRLFVHEQIYPQLTQALAAYAANIRTGDGFAADSALGPVQNRMQFERIKEVWDEVQQSGVKILYQGEAPEQGYFFPVTVLDNPPDDAPFVTKEVFGPIRSVLKYSTIDEAIQRANNTSYGLGGSVWGNDPAQLKAVAAQLRSGTVWINQHANLTGNIPFGGHKESGFGVELGLEGLKSYCNVQVIASR